MKKYTKIFIIILGFIFSFCGPLDYLVTLSEENEAERAKKEMYQNIPEVYLFKQSGKVKDSLEYLYRHQCIGSNIFEVTASQDDISDYYIKSFNKYGWQVAVFQISGRKSIEFRKDNYRISVDFNLSKDLPTQRYHIMVIKDEEHGMAEAARKEMYTDIPNIYVYEQPVLIKDILEYSGGETKVFLGTKFLEVEGLRESVVDYYKKKLEENGWISDTSASAGKYSYVFRKNPYTIELNFQRTGKANIQYYHIIILKKVDQ